MVSPLGSPNARNNQRNLERLVKARRIGKLAEEAQRLGQEPMPTVEPQNDLAIEAAKSLASKQNPTPLDNPGFWGRLGSSAMTVLETAAIPGEVGASVVRGIFDPNQRARAKEIRDATPETGVVDFLKASRESYKEKDLPLWQTLPMEIALDPLSYLPIGAAVKGIKGLTTATKAGTKTTKKLGKFKVLADDTVSDGEISKQAAQISSGKFNNLLDKIPMPGPLTETLKKTLGKIRGQSTVIDVAKDEGDRIFAEGMIRSARTENFISAAIAKMAPPLSRLKPGSQKKGLDALFEIGDKAQIRNIEASDIGKNFGVKDGDTFVGNFFEKAFVGIKQNEKLDNVAKRLGKDEWMQLDANDLRKISSYKNLSDEQLLSLRNVWGVTDDVADLLKANNIDVKLLKEGIREVKGKQVARRGYFPRKMLFDSLTEGQQKAVLKKTGDASFIKKRKLTGEFDEAIDELLIDGKLTAANSIEGVMEAYLRGAYNLVNKQKTASKLKAASLKGTTGIAWAMGKTDRRLIYDNVKTKLIAGKSVDPASIQKLRKQGYGELADILEPDPAKTKELRRRLKNAKTSQEKTKVRKEFNEEYQRNKEVFLQSIDNFNVIDKIKGRTKSKDASRIFDRQVPGQPLPKLFDNLHFEGQRGEQLRKRFTALLGTEESTTFSKLAETAGKGGDVIRVGKTGFDFGFSLLQGLPILGSATAALATGNVVKAGSLYKVWGDSTIEGFKAFFNPNSMQKFMNEMADEIVDVVDDAGNIIGQRSLLDEYVEKGGQLGRKATDMFQGNQVLLGSSKMSKARPLIEQTLGRFENNFTHASDVLRIKGYKALRSTFSKNGDDGLRQLTSFLNKATGSLNSTEYGIGPTQQAIERSFLFFSPRYTRASMSLIADVTRGGMSGAQSREALVGMAGFGLGTYITMASALGQEPELDPRSSKFLTVELGGDRLGFGSFWTSFARAATTMTDNAFTEEDIMEQQRGNPIFNYLRGRTSPVTGLAIDLYNQETFMGEELEGPIDMGKHVARAAMPFWLESSLIADPYRTGLSGTLGEIAGLRTRPMNVWERKGNRQDELSLEKFGQRYKDLNDVQKREAVAGDEEFEEYRTLAREISNRGGGELYEQLENYYEAKESIDEEHKQSVREGIELMNQNEFFTPAEFRQLILAPANRRRREEYKALNERQAEGGDLSQTKEYFDTLAKKYDEDMQPEDRAAKVFLNDIINNPSWDRPEGYNFIERDKAVRDFIDEYGTDVYDYVQKYIQSGKDMTKLEAEFINARQKYEFFWESSSKAVIEREEYSEYAQKLYEEYLQATDTGRDTLLANPEYGQYLKDIRQKISDTKSALRRLNPGLDAFLYRWGYYDKLAHERNQGEENFWRQSNHIDLGVYDDNLSV